MEEGVRAATIACIILSLAAYIFFMRFIQNFGRHAVRIQTELSLAHGIQQTLVPIIDLRSARTEIYGVSLPSAEVGGDLVDVVSLPDGSVFAYVADVAGHGLPAGILMGMIKTAVHTQLFDLPSPTAVFDRLNEVLPAVKEPHMYATCTALRIFENEPTTACRVEYAIAGQPAMLHASAATATVSQLADQQLPLGLLAAPPYQGHTVDLIAWRSAVGCNRWHSRSRKQEGVEFGFDQLESLLLENRTQPLATIAQKIHQALVRLVRSDGRSEPAADPRRLLKSLIEQDAWRPATDRRNSRRMNRRFRHSSRRQMLQDLSRWTSS